MGVSEISSSDNTRTFEAVVVGGGPAGLRAAEVIAAAGIKVALFDHKPSVGRKFLVAGRGGLNLTHTEPFEQFVARYEDEADRWRDLLGDWSVADLRAWARGLGIETFVGTSGRIFPEEKQAAPLLRRWVQRLKAGGVQFFMRHSWENLGVEGPTLAITIRNQEGENIRVSARAAVLALGGGSWPETGSDGRWVTRLREKGVEVRTLTPANCGFEVNWTSGFLREAEGLPVKNITASVGTRTVAGELLITKYGLEGGAIYQLGRELRRQPKPVLHLDLKPTFSAEVLAARLTGPNPSVEDAVKKWRLSPAAAALLALQGPYDSSLELARAAKRLPVILKRPRPIDEAISSAGGVAWSALNKNLMVCNRPGLFCAGEMIDWEAPTGGYLIHGCLATGTRAGRGVIEWIRKA